MGSLLIRGMADFEGRRILVVATGGIGIIKVALLVSSLRKKGARIRVVLTESARKFVSPLLFKSLGWGEVYTDETWWNPPLEGFESTSLSTGDASENRLKSPVLHVELAKWAEVVVVAPATASFLAKASLGIADTLASAMMLTSPPDKVLIIPSMNTAMLESPQVSSAVEKLSRWDYTVVGTGSGILACGDEGKGRIPEVPVMELLIYRMLRSRQIQLEKPCRAVVTAGPTREYMDSVRFLSNASSGKLGLSLALELWALGCDVDLIHGPSPAVDEFVSESRGYSFKGLNFVPVVSASDMLEALRNSLKGAQVLFMTAAVSDFRFAEHRSEKLKRASFPSKISVELVQNPDLLATVSREFPDVRKIAFTVADRIEESSIQSALQKLSRKGADWIVLNDVSAMGAESQRIVFISKGSLDGEVEIADFKGSKEEVAKFIVDRVLANLN